MSFKIGNRNAVRVQLEWSGIKEFQHFMNDTLPDGFTEAMTDALLSAAYDGKEKAQELVPVDTGALKQSIRVERLAHEAGKIYYTGIRAGGYIRNPRTHKLVDYAGYVETGTSRQFPQPFIRPAGEHAMKRVPSYFWINMKKQGIR